MEGSAVNPSFIIAGVVVALLLLLLWKRREINAWLTTWRMKDASVDAKLFKANWERTTPTPKPDAPTASGGATPVALPPSAVPASPVAASPVNPAPSGVTPMDDVALRRQVNDLFNREEIRTLCFDLGVDYDSLVGEGKEAHVRELIALLRRDGRLHELVALCAQRRPRADWSGFVNADARGASGAAPGARARADVERDVSRGGSITNSPIRTSKDVDTHIREDASDQGSISDSGITIE